MKVLDKHRILGQDNASAGGAGPSYRRSGPSLERRPSSPAPLQIHLDKKVPTGAGLGGGSGNAATALWAANELTGRPATNAQLLEWSADIGSDVPVFFSRGAAYCTGRGEVRLLFVGRRSLAKAP